MSQQLPTLTAAQLRAIDALLAGKSVVATARAVGCNRSTVYDWLSSEAFSAELDRQRRHLAGDVSRRLLRLCDVALATLRLGLKGKATSTQVRAALGVLDRFALFSNLTEFEGRLAALEGDRHARF